MKVTVSQTSLYAYSHLEDLGKRQRQVYDALNDLGEATNTEISRYLSLPINQITPRVKELRVKNVVVGSTQRPCRITKQKVRTWRISR